MPDGFQRHSLMPSSTPLRDSAASGLRAAIVLARNGDLQAARRLCAASIQNEQYAIVSDPSLQRLAAYALLWAEGFKQLARLVQAATGRDTQIAATPVADNVARPKLEEDRHSLRCLVDTRWLRQRMPDDVEFGWLCQALFGASANARRHPAEFTSAAAA